MFSKKTFSHAKGFSISCIYLNRSVFVCAHMLCILLNEAQKSLLLSCVPVGYSWMPLLREGRMQSVELQLPVAATLPPGYLCQDARKVQSCSLIQIPLMVEQNVKTKMKASRCAEDLTSNNKILSFVFWCAHLTFSMLSCVHFNSPNQTSSGWKMPRRCSK